MSERKVPKLRFPEYNQSTSHSYSKYIFSDIFTFAVGKNIKQNESSSEFDTPCVRYGELYHMYNEVIKAVINKTNLCKSELIFSEGDEILLPSAGEDPLDISSASALTVRNVAIGRTINILKPLKSNVYSQIYVAYYINHRLKNKIATLAKGVSISNVYNSDLKTLEITLPSFEEQTKIADFLTSIDDRIQQLTKKKELLEQYKKGVMRDVFSQKIRFKDDNGNDYPNWQEKDLKEIAEVNPKSESLPNKFYYIDLGSVNNGRVGALDYINLNDAPSRAQRVLSNNDILFQMVRPYQRNNLLFSVKSEANYVASTGYAQLRARENYDFKFIFQLLLTDNFVNTVMLRCTGTSYPAINSSDLSTITINTPKYEEQVKIADLLTNIDDKITQVSTQLEQTKLFKKSLLQQMFI